MIDTAFVEQRMRDVNPVPDVDDINPEELSHAVAAADARMAAMMQTPIQHPTTHSPPITPPPLRRRRALAFAAGFILILASIGIAALTLRGANAPVTDEPAPPTTATETPETQISVDSLTWTFAPLDPTVFPPPGPGVYPAVGDIVAGGPSLVAVGTTGRLDPADTPPSDDPTGWIRGTIDIPTVWTSPDGFVWSRVPYDEAAFGVDSEIKAVTVGGPGLVAVGDQDVWTSPDGYEWSRVTRNPTVVHPITGDLRGVIAGGPGLVAFGESAGTSAVWTSPDGYTWTQVPHDEAVFGRSSIHSVTQGGPGLVAVGVDETDRDGDQPDLTFAVVWTSLDGYTWTRVPHDPSVFSEGTGMVDVAVGGPGLVAVGFERRDESIVAAVWTSADGTSWTPAPHDEAIFGGGYEDMSSVAAVGNGFVAVGSWPWTNVWTSTDGITWTRIPRDLLGEDTSMFKVIAGGPGIVVLGGAPEGPALWVATPADADEPATAGTTDKAGAP